MKRFEFMFIPVDADAGQTAKGHDSLDEYGDEGWQIVGIIGGIGREFYDSDSNKSYLTSYQSTVVMQREKVEGTKDG